MTVYIHALREEGDRDDLSRLISGTQFLSTPSARRATGATLLGYPIQQISIHALREEGDPIRRRRNEPASTNNFYPRPPRGGRRPASPQRPLSCSISIHALREEGDSRRRSPSGSRRRYFYPRPPRGGRRAWRCCPWNWKRFLSTPSARRATGIAMDAATLTLISIHALREEGDDIIFSMTVQGKYFYPRPPRGGRPVLHRLL